MDDADRLALHELPSRYGDAIDDGDWDGLGRIFFPDATFELNGRLLEGLDAIRWYMAHEARHPRAHHMTNVWIEESGDGVVLHSRVITMRSDGSVTSGRYRDEVANGPDGWRVTHRVFVSTPRDPEARPH